ncbi:MAG: LysE family translocator [Halieaceae bacterium]
MNLIDWLSLAGVCLLGAMSPGPSLAVVVKHTLRSGAGSGIQAGLAHGSGVALYAVVVVSGLALVITASPLLYQSIQWAGVAFLLYLGLQSLRSSGAAMLDSSEASGKLQGPAVQGFTVAFLNPKLAVFFLALFSQFLRPEAALTEKTLMVATVGSIDALWYCTVSLLLARPGILQRLRASQQLIDRLFGIILIALAIRVAIT